MKFCLAVIIMWEIVKLEMVQVQLMFLREVEELQSVASVMSNPTMSL